MITKKRIDKRELPLLYLMVISVILYLLQRLYFPVIVFNEPLYFIVFPVLILIAISVYFTRNRYLFLGQSSKDTIKKRVGVIGFNTFKYFAAFGVIYFFLFLIGSDIFIKYIGPLGPTEYFSIPITQVNSGTSRTSPSIGFYFKGRYNTLRGTQFYEILKATKDKFHPSCGLSIECRKSIFNSYLVDHYYLR